MKITLRIAGFILLATLGISTLVACKNEKATKKAQNTTQTATQHNNMQGRIAFVNIDSFEANYEYLQSKRNAFDKKQKALEDELARAERQLQNEASAFQKKAQGGTMSQAEGEATQKKLMQQGQNLEQKRQSYTEQLVKEQQEFNAALQKDLKDFLAEYNKEKGFDYILSYAEGGSILLTNEALDITQDVIEGMNKRKSPSEAKDEVPANDTSKK